MALCERLSVLCGVIAQSRAFKPSDGHTALPCGLLQLSLCVPQPSPLCPLCPAEGRMYPLSPGRRPDVPSFPRPKAGCTLFPPAEGRMNNLPFSCLGGGTAPEPSRWSPPGAAPRPRQGSKGLTDIYNENSNCFSTVSASVITASRV